MNEMACFLIPLAIAVVVSGPIALIISIVALNKIKDMQWRLERKITQPQRMPEMNLPIGVERQPQWATEKPPQAVEEQPPPEPLFKPISVPVTGITPIPAPVTPTSPPEPIAPSSPVEMPKQQPIQFPQVTFEHTAKKVEKETISLEQRIGTRWVLIAGVITVFISAGFFLKFAYENSMVGPLGRVIITAIVGLAALITGEITRRRGYEIAAKGTTALGFAILYAADFTAYRFYDLIGSVPAFGIAILITAAAMAYAVALNEVIVAFLALFGGFFTPILVSTGKNLPIPLFGYVLVLSVGAMLCAYWRKWRTVNLLAFIGTFALYSGWFEKFFRSQLHASGPPEQMAIAIGWLSIFFGAYLVLPLLYGLVNRAMARKDDVWLVVINASWTSFYLWTILFEHYQTSLALCAAGLAAAHLVMMGVVFVRCREDEALRRTLLVIGLVFLTTAIPLYWHMNSVIIGWAVEGVLLVFIGIKYRSIFTQFGGVASLMLACGKLVLQLPMHTDAFRLAANTTFGIWVFVAAMVCLCHYFYRSQSQLPDDAMSAIAQVLYAASVLILFCAATLEWAAHCKYNLLVGHDLHYITRGQSIILAAAVLLFAVRPLCPSGRLTEGFTVFTLMAGVLFVIYALANLHIEKFIIFANWDFVTVCVFLISILICHIKYRLIAESPQSETGILSQSMYAVFGLMFLAVITVEWYLHCVYNLRVSGLSPSLIRGQIIVFTAGILGFIVRPLCPRGQLPRICAAGLAAAGSIFAAIFYTETHKHGFLIFANPTFITAGILAASLFVCVYLLIRRRTEEPEGKIFAVGISVLAIIFLWVVLSQEIYEYWRCRDLYTLPLANWSFIANMWMSVTWAIYGLILLVIGFWQKLKMLRYMGLSVLGVMLLKAFIVDMSSVSTIYRIMAFLATGVTLVGVSYIYQFLKKKGFFDIAPTKNLQE
jgi:uncharacterized membrane protein